MSIDTENPEPPKHALRTGITLRKILDLKDMTNGYPKGTTVKEVVDPILKVKGVKVEVIEPQKIKI